MKRPGMNLPAIARTYVETENRDFQPTAHIRTAVELEPQTAIHITNELTINLTREAASALRDLLTREIAELDRRAHEKRITDQQTGGAE